MWYVVDTLCDAWWELCSSCGCSLQRAIQIGQATTARVVAFVCCKGDLNVNLHVLPCTTYWQIVCRCMHAWSVYVLSGALFKQDRRYLWWCVNNTTGRKSILVAFWGHPPATSSSICHKLNNTNTHPSATSSTTQTHSLKLKTPEHILRSTSKSFCVQIDRTKRKGWFLLSRAFYGKC